MVTLPPTVLNNCASALNLMVEHFAERPFNRLAKTACCLNLSKAEKDRLDECAKQSDLTFAHSTATAWAESNSANFLEAAGAF